MKNVGIWLFSMAIGLAVVLGVMWLGRISGFSSESSLGGLLVYAIGNQFFANAIRENGE